MKKPVLKCHFVFYDALIKILLMNLFTICMDYFLGGGQIVETQSTLKDKL